MHALLFTPKGEAQPSFPVKFSWISWMPDMWAVFTSTVRQLEIQVPGLKVTMGWQRLKKGHYVGCTVISHIPLAQLTYNIVMRNKQCLLDVMCLHATVTHVL